MKRIRRMMTLAAMITVCVNCLTGCGGAANTLSVNGSVISEEELKLLNQNTDMAIRMKVMQLWAKEEGIEDFSYEGMLEELEEVNKQRSEGSEVVYGVTNYTPLQYYQIKMDELRAALAKQYEADASEETLLEYYQENIESYMDIGTVTANLTIRYQNGESVEQELVIDADTYRTMSESDEVLAEKLSSLSEGESCQWTDDYGQELTLEYMDSEPGEPMPFDEVSEVVRQQYGIEMTTKEVDERIKSSDIKDKR